jgi:hypothetical protein
MISTSVAFESSGSNLHSSAGGWPQLLQLYRDAA